jgi:hypothetical protein
MKLYMISLDKTWFVAAPEDMPLEKVQEQATPEFLDSNLADEVSVTYWGDSENVPHLEPDFVLGEK